jgi:hypothetical protein
MSAKHYTLEIAIHDENIEFQAEQDPVQFTTRLQNAFDREWPYARMASVRVVVVYARSSEDWRNSSATPETDRIGPLG